MTATATVTVHQLLEEVAKDTRAMIEGVMEAGQASSGDEVYSNDIAHAGIETADVQNAWLYVPETGAVRKCSRVDGATLTLKSHLRISDGTHFWLLRESPTTLATAVRQGIMREIGSFTAYRHVTVKSNNGVVDVDVGPTGSWEYIGGRLRIRIEGVDRVAAVYAGDGSQDPSKRWQGWTYPQPNWSYDYDTDSLWLDWVAEWPDLTLVCRFRQMTAADAINLNPLSREAGAMLLGNPTVQGQAYEAGMDPDAFLALAKVCSAFMLDLLGVRATYDDAITMQRQASNRRNRGNEKRELAVGRLSD